MKKLGKIKTLTIASLSAVALAAPIALAQSTSTNQDPQQVTGERHGGRGKDGGGQKGRGGRGWGGERGGRMQGLMFQGLNLTDDQKARMKEIGQSFRERTQSLHQQLREAAGVAPGERGRHVQRSISNAETGRISQPPGETDG